MSYFYIQAKLGKELLHFELDSTTEVTQSFKGSLTRYQVSNGSTPSDHYVNKPNTITMSGILTDTKSVSSGFLTSVMDEQEYISSITGKAPEQSISDRIASGALEVAAAAGAPFTGAIQGLLQEEEEKQELKVFWKTKDKVETETGTGVRYASTDTFIKKLKKVKSSKVPFTIHVGQETYTNCFFSSLTIKQDKTHGVYEEGKVRKSSFRVSFSAEQTRFTRAVRETVGRDPQVIPETATITDHQAPKKEEKADAFLEGWKNRNKVPRPLMFGAF